MLSNARDPFASQRILVIQMSHWCLTSRNLFKVYFYIINVCPLYSQALICAVEVISLHAQCRISKMLIILTKGIKNVKNSRQMLFL